MRFISTREPGGAGHSLSEAIRAGLAPDGGLFVPQALPTVEPPDETEELPREAARFLRPFFVGDALEPQLESICAEAFDFPCPLTPLGTSDRMLELFHGPTAAFKDFGARFLSACLARLQPADSGEQTVMVATSGDTGGAVAAAFADRTHTRVWILYPEGRVSPRQEAQLTCWGAGVVAMSVSGSFDDCQSIVKQAFARDDLRERYGLTSANSINIGRLLPQAAYHWYAAVLHRRQTGAPMRPIVPTGNLGHGLAAAWARAVGAPIGDIVFALNANRAVLDLLEHGLADPRDAVPTVANAMDVGVPSNLERLRHLFPDLGALRRWVQAFSFTDREIEDAIRGAEGRWGVIPCPHTACALLARERLDTPGWTVVATAHPAKFEQVIEPIVGRELALPPALEALMTRPQHRVRVEPTLDAVLRAVGAE